MKNRAFLTTLMLLSVPLCFSSGTYAQTKDPERDLPVVFSGTRTSGEWFDVNGEVTNNSVNTYACVYINFSMYARPADVRSSGRHLGDIAVEVRDLQPRSARKFAKILPNTAWLVRKKSVTECSAPPESKEVILFEHPNFGGRSKSFGINPHSLVDFNEIASSIKVPADLVVIVYEHSAGPGPYDGYGLWVDFLEDQPNLAQYNLDNKISHLKIVSRRTSDAVWVRNRLQNGQFEGGHYQVIGRRGGSPPANPNPLIGPPIPAPRREPPPPPPLGVCTISGEVKGDEPRFRTRITLHRGGSATSFSMQVTGRQYRFTNVPEGRYEVKGTGNYGPSIDTPRGPVGKDIFAEDTQWVTCQPNGSHIVTFEIRSTGG